MTQTPRTYIAIDLKSFYASVECVERGLDPLTTNLVVADKERTNKTICLAVSPSLKSYGISGRARLYEVEQAVNKLNRIRQKNIHWKNFKDTSYDYPTLEKDPYLGIDYRTLFLLYGYIVLSFKTKINLFIFLLAIT